MDVNISGTFNFYSIEKDESVMAVLSKYCKNLILDFGGPRSSDYFIGFTLKLKSGNSLRFKYCDKRLFLMVNNLISIDITEMIL